MKFDLHSPCKSCPFRRDVRGFIHPERAEEIIEAILYRDQTFTCHKTVDYDRMPDDAEDYLPGDKDQHCAGATIFLEKQERPNQMMRIAERLGFYDRSKLKMDAPVFDDEDEMVAHMEAAHP